MSFHRAFIQVQQKGRPEIEAHALLETLASRGVQVEEFTSKRLARRQLPMSRDTLVAGDLDVMRMVFKFLSILGPFLPSYPNALLPRLGRSVWETTLGEVQDGVADTGRPVFVKPLDDAKRFTGFVMRNRNDAFRFGDSSRRLRVVCSEVVSFEHEHRAYVVEGEVLAVEKYAGEGRSSATFVKECVAELSAAGEAPRGFALDVGVLDDGEHVVVECNEGFGLGLYPGVPFEVYTDLVCARWQELSGNRAEQA